MIVDEETEVKVKSAKSPEKKLELATDAIRFALRRVESDPDFRWHMAGTETHARLITAYAAITERPLKQFNADHEKRMLNEDGEFETPRHKKLDELRSDFCGIDLDDLPAQRIVDALKNLQQFANDI